MDERERMERWAKVAVERELEKIRGLPQSINIFLPGNEFWQSLFKIAGVVNGGYKTPNVIFIEIEGACSHLALEEKTIRYQWQRACKQAQPRRLSI